MRVRTHKAPHIEPEAVVRAALEILDAEGLERVTLRQISSKLGVQAPALYWHFKNKRDITDDMAQAILVQGGLEDIKRPRDSAAWAEWLIETARAVRRAMVSHRDGGRVVAGASFSAKTLARLAILTTRVLNDAGFDLLHASLATATTFDYVWGYVIEEQAGEGPEPGSAPPQGQEVTSPYGLDLMDADLMDAIMTERDKLTATEKFEWGLRVIVNGLKPTLADRKKKIKT
ncbi:MAG: TetR/AcrR family transcriptional regulator C-terminal domain-containing protein [Nitrososphaerales archaeon]|jgi:TetR/AcrR family tetracycline transcriptional repressor